MRFLTITCNPAVDTTYLIGSLVPGAINRVERALPAAGGKGNNVARVLARLGHRPVATGFLGGHTGEFIRAGLQASGVEPSFVEIGGATRICLTVVEHQSGRTTEIREPGSAVSGRDVDRLLAFVAGIAAATDVAVISGSLPPGAPSDLYARLIAVLKSAGVFVALDSSGEALRIGAAAGPDLLKPNRDELADLVGSGVQSSNAIDTARTALIGPMLPSDGSILLSLGAAGAALIRAGRTFETAAPPVAVRNTVGAGDALLAGFLHARSRGLTDHDSLAFAVATGSASARAEAVGSVDPSDIDRLLAAISGSPNGSTAQGVVA